MSHRNRGSNWIRKDKRLAIYMRDGCACVYCGSKGRMTLDHVRSRAKGGGNKSTNLVTCCAICNRAKASKSLTTWLSELDDKGARALAAITLIRRRPEPLKRALARRMIEYGKQLSRGEGKA